MLMDDKPDCGVIYAHESLIFEKLRIGGEKE